MSEFKKISAEEIDENLIKLIGKEWMLITAGDETKWNTMTASWGGMGFMWNMPTALTVVRPQRYTFEFTEKFPKYTLCFFDEKYRKALSFCGSHSGRDFDKAKETGLTPVYGDGYTYFKEAKLVLICEKLYNQWFTPESFVDRSIIDDVYPTGDFHKMYIGKITECLQKNA